MSETLKIGITCYPSVGGSGVLATTLGLELAKRGHEVHFISYERPVRLPENNDHVLFHQVKISDYGLFKYPDYTLPLSVKMAAVSCKHKLDILHVHYAVPHASAAVLAKCMLAADLRPKIVTTLHGTDTTLLGRDPGYGPAILYALKQSDAVTAVSAFLKAESKSVLGFEGDIEVIHNFFEPAGKRQSRQSIRAELGVLDNETLIVHSSNLRPVKRIGLLLETVARINPAIAFKVLILAGSSFAPFNEDLRRLQVQDRIVVRENAASVEDYLAAADLGLYTSETESFCLSILEAMRFACPSVSTKVGGIPELVEDSISGLLVDSANSADIAEKLELLIIDKQRRLAMGEAAKLRAEALFCADLIVPRYEHLYRSVLDKQT